MACRSGLVTFFENAVDVFDLTVASSTRMPTASASPPSVMMLIVSCRKLSTNRSQDGQRNGDGDDERAAPTAEEQQNHDAGKRRGNDRFANHTADRAAHKDGLVGEGSNFQLRRQGQGGAGQNLSNSGNDVESGCSSGLENADQHSAMAVLSHDIGLRRKPIAYPSHVPQVDRFRSDLLDGKVTKLCDRARGDVHANVKFAFRDLCRAGRQDKILRIHRIQNIVRRDVFGLHQVLIHVDHDLPWLAAIGKRNDSARHGNELSAQEIEREIVKLLFGQSRPGNTQLKDRDTRSAEVDDLRRLNGRRRDRRINPTAATTCAFARSRLAPGCR